MKTLITILFVFLFFANEIMSQVVTGKLVDENGSALPQIQLHLYTPTYVYSTTSNSDGLFSFNIITGIEDNQLPAGYSVSDNFPNPFNPRTRIGITLPNSENVKVEVFNLLGQAVAGNIENTFDAGTNYIDLELNGLPNGFYISRITIGDKYTIVKKMMLIYGSQHLVTDGGIINSPSNKTIDAILETTLDSLVATSPIIERKTFTNLPNFVSGTLDLGNLTLVRYCTGTVLYEGKTYNTVHISNQCWLKENLDIGTRINGSQNASNDSVIEKYCYSDDPTNCTTYGGLYQWDEAMQYTTTQRAKGICPTGWHIPTLTEFQTLSTAVNNDGNELKAVGQGIGAGAGTNISGFSALLAGGRSTSFYFYGLGEYAYFWSSTGYGVYTAYAKNLFYTDSGIYLYSHSKERGFSVRCVKD